VLRGGPVTQGRGVRLPSHESKNHPENVIAI
jgi:hypothetical protein